MKVFKMRIPMRPEWLMRKGFQLATIEGITFVNTHLSANRDDDWSLDNRYTRVAAAELDELAAALPTGPLLVTGDFNLPRESVVLQRFREATGLTDIMSGQTEPTYRPTSQWPNPPALDQVFASPGLAATATLVFRDAVTLGDGTSSYLSDHYGIETVLG